MLIAVDQGEPGNFERQIANWFKIADQGRPGDRWLIDTVRFDEAVHKASRPKSKFAGDSLLEEIGFELVPCRAASRQGPTNCPAIIIAGDDRNYLQPNER